MHYTLRDHQGSLTATVCGNTVERLSYDAWGRRRNPNGFGYSNVTHTFDWGYTGQEHLTAFCLINMNGRCYDPVTSHFLSVDAYVQDPTSAQAFNRYAYCAYNPLRYTDPTGWLCGNPNPIRQSNSANYNAETTWQSDDINDVLWGRSVHPCETGNPYWTNSTFTSYTQGNRGLNGCNYTVDRKGYVKNVGSNNKEYDILFNAEAYDNEDYSRGLIVYDENLLVGLTEERLSYFSFDRYGNGRTGNYSSTVSIDEAFKVFDFMVQNTVVEWEISGFRSNGSNEYVIATMHHEGYVTMASVMKQYSVYNKIFAIHNHPDEDGTKGGSSIDVYNIDKIHKIQFISSDIHHWFICNGQKTVFPKHYVFHNHSSTLYYYTPEKSNIYIRKISTYRDFYRNLGFE